MQPVNILRDDSFQNAAPLQFRQRDMPCIGLNVPEYPVFPVKLEERFRMVHKETVGSHLFRAELLVEPLAVDSIRAAKIRHPGLRGHPGAAEEHNIFTLSENLCKRFYTVHRNHLSG